MRPRWAAVVALALAATFGALASGCGANDNGGVITPPKNATTTLTTPARNPGY